VGTSLTAEPLLALGVTVSSEQRVESVLQSIVQGLAAQPGVALARIWLVPSADLPSFYHVVSDAPGCLCLVASAGTPINSPGEDWYFLWGHFARVPFNVGKVGQVAASRHPILVEDATLQNDWIVRPEWAKREEIRSFAGHPLIFRDKLLGVVAVFSRKPLGPREFTWLGLFANQAAVAIANACAEEALRSSERNLAALINAIPTAAWATRPDGYCDFLNQVWLDYAAMTLEQAQGWGWAESIHPDDRKKLVEEWQSCLASGTPIDTEARIRRFDSSYRCFLIRGNPLKDEGGKILKWYGTCVDIEDRKRGEEALRARELSWRQTVDNIPGLVATAGAMGEVEFLNRQTLEYFGKTTEELKDWALIGVVHPDDLPRQIEAWAASIETGQIFDIEARLRRADGVFRWFQVRGLPVRDAENKVAAWYLHLTDIDDRKKAEEALQSSERNLNLTINAIPAMVGELGADGSLRYVNQAALDYAGFTVEDLQKGDFRARLYYSEDFERQREERRLALTRPIPFENEQRILGKDGRYRWFLNRYNPVLDEQGRIDRWYVASFDIEDRKRAEEVLRASELDARSVLDNMPGLLARLSPDGIPEIFNRPYLQYLGKTVEEIKNWQTSDIIHPDDLAHTIEVLGKAISTGQPFDFEYRARRFDGVYRWFQSRLAPVRNAEGQILYWNALATDIDDRKRAEGALDRARSELAHVTRVTTLNALTASIAHEVNQPLTGIVSNAGATLRFLSGDAPNLEEAREAVHDIARDAKRAGEIIARIRALTKGTPPRPEKLDLNETISEVLTLIGDEAKRNNVIVRTQFDSSLSPVAGDRVQLQQVVLNLVMNAIEAMSSVSERPRELVITTQNIDPDCVQATVEDSGIGIASNTVDKIFDSFYTTKSGGMGMGLSISRSILQSHGGRLWAVGKDGPGTVFQFTVPKYREKGAHAPARST
jgi:PAS domain S-box-containing protein